jgi:hypothetical protein
MEKALKILVVALIAAVALQTGSMKFLSRNADSIQLQKDVDMTAMQSALSQIPLLP